MGRQTKDSIGHGLQQRVSMAQDRIKWQNTIKPLRGHHSHKTFTREMDQRERERERELMSKVEMVYYLMVGKILECRFPWVA